MPVIAAKLPTACGSAVGNGCGADPDMLRYFGAAPDFPDRIPDQPEPEPARW